MAKEKITKKHLIAFEIDEDHKEDMHKLCKKYFPSDNIVIEKDLAGKNRYAFIYSEKKIRRLPNIILERVIF